MHTNLGDLVGALPDEFDPPPSLELELARVRRSNCAVAPPCGRFARMWSLSSLSAQIAAAHGICWLRTRFADADRAEVLRAEAAWRAGLRLVGTMGYMRGAIAKLGQVLACYPDVLPQQTAELLESLHSEAPPMHFALVREQLEHELGETVEHAFADFEVDAFAAASLGQVHRASVAGFGRVAVKIQYPSIARAIQADLSNARLLMQPLRLGDDWRNLVAQLDELGRTLERETDYLREALWTERARHALAELSDVVVPRVCTERSSRRVLTTELLVGRSLGDYLAQHPSQEDRDRRGVAILRSCMRLWSSHRFFNTDPGPGNFVFFDDGRVGLIDFGSCREFTSDEWAVMRLGVQACREGGAVQLECLRQSSLRPDLAADDEEARLRQAVSDWLWEPMRRDGPFDFGDDAYIRNGVRLLGESLRRGSTRQMPVFVWSLRQFYGVRALLWALRARVDFHAIAEAEYARAGI